MIDFIQKTHEFYKRCKRSYVSKLRIIVLVAIVGIVVLGAAMIALSNYILPLIVAIALFGLVVWVWKQVSLKGKKEIINFIRSALEKLLDLINNKEDELNGKNYSPLSYSFRDLLGCATEEERRTLEQLSGKKFKSTEDFDLTIRRKSTHEFNYWLKRLKGTDAEFVTVTYSEMLDMVGDVFKEERNSQIDSDYERSLVELAFSKMVGSLEDADRKLLEHKLSHYAEKELDSKNTGLMLTSGGLLAGNLGGFATYTMSTSLLASGSSALGLTLPFAAYTSLSTVLSTILGPVGVSAVGLWGAHKMASPDVKTTVLIVLAVAAIRARLIFEQQERKREVRKEIASYTSQKEALLDLLERLEGGKSIHDVEAAIECMAPLNALGKE